MEAPRWHAKLQIVASCPGRSGACMQIPTRARHATWMLSSRMNHIIRFVCLPLISGPSTASHRRPNGLSWTETPTLNSDPGVRSVIPPVSFDYVCNLAFLRLRVRLHRGRRTRWRTCLCISRMLWSFICRDSVPAMRAHTCLRSFCRWSAMAGRARRSGLRREGLVCSHADGSLGGRFVCDCERHGESRLGRLCGCVSVCCRVGQATR